MERMYSTNEDGELIDSLQCKCRKESVARLSQGESGYARLKEKAVDIHRVCVSNPPTICL